MQVKNLPPLVPVTVSSLPEFFNTFFEEGVNQFPSFVKIWVSSEGRTCWYYFCNDNATLYFAIDEEQRAQIDDRIRAELRERGYYRDDGHNNNRYVKYRIMQRPVSLSDAVLGFNEH